ncbi:MAG TPA: HAMP domain-containing sensor histidine kinase [Polyangiales bacterium]|nr:HAMP domain-containing sensor histidine kinase [Polyangiales bacterium]
MTRTLVARVAWVQTLVTLVAFAIVVVATWLAVRWMLVRQTDRVLEDLLARTVDYLEAGPADEHVDWQWLAAEIDEGRPRDVRVELRDRAQTRIQLGTGAPLGVFESGCKDRDGLRVCGRSGTRYAALAARDRTAELAVGRRLMLALSLACLLAGAGVALASVSVTRRALRPLAELAQRVAAVEPGSGEAFQPRASLRELEGLERRFSELVGRFEQTLLREKQFTAHASHELRTPLTLARAEVEALPNSEAALAALARLESLIEVLLWFARTQAPLHGDDMEVVNFADVLAQQLTDVKPISLPDEALVRGDEQLLERAAQNLLDNARKYGAGSDIGVSLSRDSHQLVLRITNGGPGIPEPLREQIFVPFVRGQHAVAGFGLGLPFARAIARAHGGDVVLEQAAETRVIMRLPLVAWHEDPAGSGYVQNGRGT